jgi:hypothetical protein
VPAPGELRRVTDSANAGTYEAPEGVDFAGGLRDAENDDRAVVLERLVPAVGHGLENRHRGRGRGRSLHFLDGAADPVDPEPAASLDAAFSDPVRDEDQPLVGLQPALGRRLTPAPNGSWTGPSSSLTVPSTSTRNACG